MALNYAEKYSPELLDIIIDGTYTSPFVNSNVDWTGAKTFHFTQMSTSGFKPHSRNGGWNSGAVAQDDKTFSVEHDRDIAFLVDKADVDETARTAAVQNVATTFVKTHQVPETDAQFFSKVYAYADAAGMTAEQPLSAYSKDKVFSQLKADIGKVRMYKNKGIIVYVSPDVMDSLSSSTEIQKNIEVTTISESGKGIETRIATIDGVPIMEVIDTDRFYSAYDYEPENGGFEPDTDAVPLQVLIATPLTTKLVPKISSIYYFSAGSHTEGDGDLYQHRALWDTFVFPNGKDGAIDSVYVVTLGAEPEVEADTPSV